MNIACISRAIASAVCVSVCMFECLRVWAFVDLYNIGHARACTLHRQRPRAHQARAYQVRHLQMCTFAVVI